MSQLFEQPSSMYLGTAVPVFMLFRAGKGVKQGTKDMWPKAHKYLHNILLVQYCGCALERQIPVVLLFGVGRSAAYVS